MACYVENLFLKASAIMVRYDVGPVKDGKVGEGMASEDSQVPQLTNFWVGYLVGRGSWLVRDDTHIHTHSQTGTNRHKQAQTFRNRHTNTNTRRDTKLVGDPDWWRIVVLSKHHSSTPPRSTIHASTIHNPHAETANALVTPRTAQMIFSWPFGRENNNYETLTFI